MKIYIENAQNLSSAKFDIFNLKYFLHSVLYLNILIFESCV